MTRDAATRLAHAVADAGFSCALSITVLRNREDDEHCSVQVQAGHLPWPKVQALADLGEVQFCYPPQPPPAPAKRGGGR